MIQRNTNYSIKIKHDYLINHTNMGYLGALPRGNSFRTKNYLNIMGKCCHYMQIDKQKRLQLEEGNNR